MQRRRLLISFILILVVAALCWASGQQDTQPIKFGIEGGDYNGNEQIGDVHFPDGYFATVVIPRIEEETEIDINFHIYKGEAAQNTKIIDADLISNYPADILLAYGGRVAKYSNERFGVDLSKYLPAEFINQFTESSLKPFQTNGIQYGLPISGWATCLLVNRSIIKRAGVEHLIPEAEEMDRSWTIDEFMEVMKAVKALDDGTYGTFIMAGMTGGDYWMLNFFAGFGAKYYDEGEIKIASPEGVEALTFIKMLQDEGYAPPGGAGLQVGDMLNMIFQEKVAIIGADPGWALGFPANSVKSGFSEEEWEAVIMEFPHIPGRVDPGTPVCFGPDAAMIINNGDEERIKKAAEVLQYIVGPETQKVRAAQLRFSPLKESENLFPDNPHWRAVKKMSEVNGVWDMGIGHMFYSDVREIWMKHFQGALTGELTPQEALEKFQAHANEMIGK
jgi:multiple sugar transport system substrate-binding protein